MEWEEGDGACRRRTIHQGSKVSIVDMDGRHPRRAETRIPRSAPTADERMQHVIYVQGPQVVEVGVVLRRRIAISISLERGAECQGDRTCG